MGPCGSSGSSWAQGHRSSTGAGCPDGKQGTPRAAPSAHRCPAALESHPRHAPLRCRRPHLGGKNPDWRSGGKPSTWVPPEKTYGVVGEDRQDKTRQDKTRQDKIR